MSNRLYLVVSATLFSLVAIAHLIRIVADLAVTIDGYVLPMYLSWLGLFIPAALAISAARLLVKTA